MSLKNWKPVYDKLVTYARGRDDIGNIMEISEGIGVPCATLDLAIREMKKNGYLRVDRVPGVGFVYEFPKAKIRVVQKYKKAHNGVIQSAADWIEYWEKRGLHYGRESVSSWNTYEQV